MTKVDELITATRELLSEISFLYDGAEDQFGNEWKEIFSSWAINRNHGGLKDDVATEMLEEIQRKRHLIKTLIQLSRNLSAENQPSPYFLRMVFGVGVLIGTLKALNPKGNLAHKIHASGSSKGGTTKAIRLKELNASKWSSAALELATAIRAKKPDRNQKNLASDIQNDWKSEDIPTFEWLLTFIRAAEKNGSLKRRVPRP